jgi:RHS repeat-associated protein
MDDKDVGEYYREPGSDDAQAKQLLLPDTVLPNGLTADEEREACRTLKGAMLRQEIYALDGSPKAPHPYTVTEQNFTIRLLQPMATNPHAVFFTHPRESISYQYERNPADPRVAHAMTLEVDGYGNVLKAAAIAYGRRQPDSTLEARDQVKQTELHVTYSENAFTNAVEASDSYRTPLPCESRSYELTGLVLPAGTSRFSLTDLQNAGSTSASIPYEETPTTGLVQKRLIEHVRTLYRSDDLSTALPLGQAQSLALPFEAYKLAFTPGLVSEVYGPRVNNSMFASEGHYVHSEGDDQWWIPSGRAFYSAGPTDDASTELVYARQHFFLPLRFQDPFGQVTVISLEHDLLPLESRDPLGNTITVGDRTSSGIQSGNDYRVLQPRLVTDANGNRAAVAFDVMGMVVGTAIMGKRDETPRRGDLLESFNPDLADDVIAAHLADPLADPNSILARATTRLIYDLFAYYRTKQLPKPQPTVVYTMVRETHDADLAVGQLTKIQHSFSYSDGFGREMQKKIQAEPGPVPQRDANGNIVVGADGQPQMTSVNAVSRWVGSGWTIFNNKSKPVRQFEPFFTDTPHFEEDVRVGVSPVLFYDPPSRVVATLNPDHTWGKMVFDPWRQESWDVNDTVLVSDPKTDPDVGDFSRRLPDNDYLPAWYAQRQTGGIQEQIAAAKAAIHAATPSISHADSLGRTFLTIAHNKFQRSTETSLTEQFLATRAIFDIEGNQREVLDANDRIVMHYDYNMLGQQVHQASMEAGERWGLTNILGNPMYGWDSRDHRFRTAYDELHRPTDSFLSEGSSAEVVIGRTAYGEARPNPENKNQRGKAVQHFDQSGVVTSEDYDFKGNLLAGQRQFAHEYKETLNWSANVPLDPDIFTSSSTFDALNRPTEQIAPDASRIRHSFNEANLLERVEANVRGEATITTFVSNIDYDSKGRRTLIEYGNNTQTRYKYDPQTFRLTNLTTTRLGFPTDQQVAQDLSYTCDPAGNIIHIQDDADLQNVVFFRNRRVEPSNDYIYDAIYRLIEARGREQLGLNSDGQPLPPTASSYNDVPRAGLLHPGDGKAIGIYIEQYDYDPVGNFLQFVHRGSDPANPGWTRSYTYNETSLLELDKASNRLTLSTVSGDQPLNENYTHDAHGNMTAMPQLQMMQWDFADQLSMTQRQAVNATDADGATHQGERTYYVYDGAGQRARKITESSAGIKRKERFYLGGFEVYREYEASGAISLEREALYLMDDHQRVALVEIRTQGSEADIPQRLVRYQFSNHLGSASLELDDQAQVISYEEYCPYGNTSYQAGRSLAEVALKRYRYTGMERDEESGLNYHGARYYAAWLAIFVSPDPHFMKYPAWSPFCYASANPTMFYDPTGRDSIQASADLDANLIAIRKLRESGDAVFAKINEAEKEFAVKGPATTNASEALYSGTSSSGQKLTSAERAQLEKIQTEGLELQAKLKSLNTEAREIGRRLEGANKFLNTPAEKLLSKIDEGNRAVYSGILNAEKTGVSSTLANLAEELELGPFREIGWKAVKVNLKGGGGGGGFGGASGGGARVVVKKGGGGTTVKGANAGETVAVDAASISTKVERTALKEGPTLTGRFVKTVGRIGLDVAIGWVAGNVGNFILWHGNEGSDTQKDQSFTLFSMMPPQAVLPVAVNVRVMSWMYGGMVKDYYFGRERRMREENPDFTSRDIDEFMQMEDDALLWPPIQK